MSITVDIRKRLGSFALNMQFDCEEKILGFLGASGSGKSMLLNCIAGLETPDEGKIIVDGTVYFDSKEKVNLPTAKRRIGYVFQNYALFPHMTVLQNVMYGLKNIPKQEKLLRVLNLLETMQLLHVKDSFPSQLSGGQQQRTALARSLILEPAIMLMDEPFSALDYSLKKQLEREMLSILSDFKGRTLFVTHNMEEAYSICSSIAVCSAGRILALEKKDVIFTAPPVLFVQPAPAYKNALQLLEH